MITEVVDIRILPGRQAEFDAAIVDGVTSVIARARGFRGWSVRRGIESPERYLLTIWWDSVEDHMVGFRESEDFARWRAIVGPYFAQPPQVEHFAEVGAARP